MKKSIYLMLAVLILMSLLAACGSKNSEPAASEEKKEDFVFASSGLYPPFNYQNNNKLVGFDVEIGTAIAEELGMNPKPVTNPWQTIIAALQAEKFDAIIGSMAITDERLKEVNFTDPYYESGAQVFISEDNDSIKTVDDLKGKTIGVVVSSTFEENAKEYTDDVKTYDSDVTALQDLLVKGRLDAVITDQLVGMYAVNENNLKIKQIDEPIYLDKMGIAIRKEDEKLLEDVNKALQTLKENGKYGEISEKYFGEDISK
ncbi:transporter substrate-binding domain-containing protein [Siminovitchia acidinfaciens]|uniref:Transporter substrate-binding domain-containing protein n=1 Tax=Siminovitchia acidinfaciens TaxID=2321395 RepID=A0A429XUZ4_9BACI|nr:transporter substrate-binding domain-containing protein [Siminovitchia acidinfaciens]RST71998.1 transporter substrate-binding domain-containing protein [Siminovitchia acidinfaciens]